VADGYTALVCAAPGCGLGDPATVAAHLVDVVRDAVGSSSHGILVSTGCLFDRASCRLRPTAPVVLVQPCDEERRPTAHATRIGPLRTMVDVESLGGWLRAGDLDPGLLPAHLLVLHRHDAERDLSAPPG
jgi:hypothetical protein